MEACGIGDRSRPRRRRRRWSARGSATLALAVCTLALVGACAGGDGSSSARGVPGPRAFTAADVEVLGTSDALAVVVDLDVLPDGRVWVLNSVEPFFVGFGPDGTTLGEHGTLGGGAAELRNPVGLVAGGIDGEAWALDAGRPALVRISRPDAWLDARLPPDSLPPVGFLGGGDLTFTRVRAARLGDDVVLPRTRLAGTGGVRAIWRSILAADLVAWNTRSGSARTVVRLGDVLGDLAPHVPPPLPFPPFPVWFRLWAVCPDGSVHAHDRIRNQLRRFAADGTESSPLPLPEPTLTEVTPDEFAFALLDAAAVEAAGSIGLWPPPVDTAALLAGLRPRIEGDGRELAAHLPRYVDLHCADDGVLWIRPFDVERGGLRGGPLWLRITPDGRIQEVTLPGRFDPLRFTADRIWGVQRDELDVASVAWIDW